jgi:hypothetical protein
LWLVALAAAGGGAYAWWRDHRDDDRQQPAEWPPLVPTQAAPPSTSKGDQGPASADEAPANGQSATSAPAATAATSSPIEVPAASVSSATASVVNALVDAPEARSTDGVTGGWSAPLPDGSCPVGYSIKANDNSGIFHLPDGRFYARTKPERCYSNAEAAVAEGYRQAKS